MKISPCLAMFRRSRRKTARGRREASCRHTTTALNPGVSMTIRHHADRSRFGSAVNTATRTALRSARTKGQHGGELLHRSEEHTSELQSHVNLVCRLLLEKKKK